MALFSNKIIYFIDGTGVITMHVDHSIIQSSLDNYLKFGEFCRVYATKKQTNN